MKLFNLLFLFFCSSPLFSQNFVKPEKLFERFEYYYDDDELVIQFRIALTKDTTDFPLDEIKIIKGVYLFYNDDNTKSELKETVYKSEKFPDLKIVIKDTPFGMPISGVKSNWEKMEFKVIYQLRNNGIQRESQTYVVTKCILQKNEIIPKPKIEKFTFKSHENNEVTLMEISFEPKDNKISLEKCTARNGDFIARLKKLENKDNNTYVVELQEENKTSFPQDKGNYEIEISYKAGVLRKSYSNKIDYPLEKARTPFEIEDVTVIDKKLSIQENVINVIDDVDMVLKVTTNQGGVLNIEYGSKLTAKIPNTNFNTKKVIHEIPINFGTTKVPDGLYNLKFVGQASSDNKLLDEYKILKNTRRNVNYLKYDKDENNDLKVSIRLNTPAPSKSSEILKIKLRNTPSDKYCKIVEKDGVTTYSQTFTKSQLDSYKSNNKNQKNVIFEVLYDNSLIFTFESILFSESDKMELLKVVQEVLEDVNKDKVSGNNDKKMQMVEKLATVLKIDKEKMQSELSSVADLTVDIAKNSKKIGNDNFGKVAANIGKTALKIFKAVVL